MTQKSLKQVRYTSFFVDSKVFENIETLEVIIIVEKKDIWKYEEPICSFNANILRKGYFYVPIKIVKKLNLDKNKVCLFRLSKLKDNCIVSKLSPVSKNSFVVKISNHILKNYQINKKEEIEIIYIKNLEKNNGILKCSNGIIDLKLLLGNFLCIDRPDKWITVYGANGGMKRMTLRRYIKLDYNLLWSMGFYLAEGLKKGDRCGVTNEKKELVIKFRDCLEKNFGISRDEWYVELNVPQENAKLKHWTRILDVDEKQVHIKVINHNPPKNNVASIILNSKIMGKIYNNLILTDNITNIIKEDNELAMAFIRGLESGDGSILHHNGCIEPTITCDKDYSQVISKLLYKIYGKRPFIRNSHTCNKVLMVYYRGNNVARDYIIKRGFLEHLERRSKLIRLFKTKRDNEIKYLKILKEKPRNVRTLSKLFNVTYNASNNFLRYLSKLELVKTNIKKEDYRRRYFELSDKGKRLLREIESH